MGPARDEQSGGKMVSKHRPLRSWDQHFCLSHDTRVIYIRKFTNVLNRRVHSGLARSHTKDPPFLSLIQYARSPFPSTFLHLPPSPTTQFLLGGRESKLFGLSRKSRLRLSAYSFSSVPPLSRTFPNAIMGPPLPATFPLRRRQLGGILNRCRIRQS